MRKQTQTAAVANPSAEGETRRADRASKAKATARADAQLARDETESEGGVSQWARELARRAEGKGNACRRYDALAVALLSVYEAGKPAVTFAEANKLSGLSRGERGDAVQSWRLAVQRMRASHGGAEAFAAAFGFDVAVDAEAGRLLLSKAGA